jgi:hypothetical protein
MNSHQSASAKKVTFGMDFLLLERRHYPCGCDEVPRTEGSGTGIHHIDVLISHIDNVK